MKLLIIRHGESEGDLRDVHEGRADFPLTDRGHLQAERMAQAVAARYRVDAIYCSPLRRAQQTARHLERSTSAPLALDDDLMEFDNGLLAGMERSVARAQYPDVPDLPPHASVYGQESMLEFRFRAERALSRIIAASDADATVAVVTHGGMISRLYRAFLRLPIGSDALFMTGDTGVHEWRIEGDRRVIVRANDTEHAKDI